MQGALNKESSTLKKRSVVVPRVTDSVIESEHSTTMADARHHLDNSEDDSLLYTRFEKFSFRLSSNRRT